MHKDQLLLLLILHPCLSIPIEFNLCTNSCGEVADIGYPFRVKGDPNGCGKRDHELACVNNHTVLNLYSGQYYVRSIDYAYRTIRVADVGLQKGNCSSLPLHSLSCGNFSFKSDPYRRPCAYDSDSGHYSVMNLKIVSIVGCAKAVNSPLYIDVSSCLDGLSFSNSSRTGRRAYAMIDARVSSVETACTIELIAMIPWRLDENDLRSYAEIHEHMVAGFELSWIPRTKAESILSYYLSRIAEVIYWDPLHRIDDTCYRFNLNCGTGTNSYLNAMLWLFVMLFVIVLPCMVVKFILGAPCVMSLLIRKWRRRHLAMDQNVEEFLQSNNNFLPIRYSYSDIKKITGGLKGKLGEGGYGSVFKGRLRSGRDVAVKILKGKTNGQDFISEVATIGRIHHFNVVGLIGYCFEGSKQALVYDFMHNGSLDKHIFSRVEGTSLDCKEVYEIALGVVRGIEYLHRGCDVQILHFDIKPHNILLDRDFTPKVSDFGLARLYPTDYNTVTLTAARGTLGYMAPELVYKNLGGISYKADVYSFGKLLIEMASGRKSWDAVVECSSQTYFPLWVHDQLSEGLDIPLEQASKEDRRIVKKMIIVALWCIQWSPSDRPSMRKVLEMLEREADDLQLPPKPLFYPAEVSTRDDGTWTEEANDITSTPSASAMTYEDSHLEYTSGGITQV